MRYLNNKDNFDFQKKMMKSGAGFTLIELIVVIGLMGIFTAAVLVNFNSQRGPRNLRIAQNEIVTNLRKVQSYALSSRDSKNGPAKYYILNLNKTESTYNIGAIQTDYSFTTDVETIKLPDGITISKLELSQPVGATAIDEQCVQVALGLPFGTGYMDSSCAIDLAVKDPARLSTLMNSELQITLTDSRSNTSKTIIYNGVSGTITSQ